MPSLVGSEMCIRDRSWLLLNVFSSLLRYPLFLYASARRTKTSDSYGNWWATRKMWSATRCHWYACKGQLGVPAIVRRSTTQGSYRSLRGDLQEICNSHRERPRNRSPHSVGKEAGDDAVTNTVSDIHHCYIARDRSSWSEVWTDDAVIILRFHHS